MGAILGLLLAPQSGNETRKKIIKIKDQALDDVGLEPESTDTLIEKTRASIEDGFNRLSEIIDQNKGIAQDESNEAAKVS